MPNINKAHEKYQKIGRDKQQLEHKEERKEKNAARRRERNLKKYNLTLEGYGKMFLAQNGCCAICKQLSNNKSLSVNYDHLTNKVRGLLCQKCNLMLGCADNSTETLAKAIEYLNLKKSNINTF